MRPAADCSLVAPCCAYPTIDRCCCCRPCGRQNEQFTDYIGALGPGQHKHRKNAVRHHASGHHASVCTNVVPILSVQKMVRLGKPRQVWLCCRTVMSVVIDSLSRMQVLFSLGFVLATVYHICHMHEEGLQSAELFGISGPLWRTWDIICAQWLLARTFGHVVGARHWVTQGTLRYAVNLRMCEYTSDHQHMHRWCTLRICLRPA